MENHLLNEQILESSTSKKFQAKEHIFYYGDKANKVYLIIEGLVQLFIKGKAGKEREIARLKSGDILGEAALLDKDERVTRARTTEETTLLAFTPTNFKSLINQESILNENIITTLCKRLYQLEENTLDLAPLFKKSELSFHLPKEEPTKKAAQIKQSKETKKEETAVKNKSRDEITQNNDFYLSGHKDYKVTADSIYNNYTYQKKINCPICSSDFKAKKIRNSKLSLQDIRDDLRPIYQDFKPIWYKIWICPNCFYTARRTDFFDFSSRQEEKVRNQFREEMQAALAQGYQLGYSEPRTINEVFAAYYTAIKLYHLIEAREDKLGYLWLSLSWLYEDMEDEKLAEKASFKAMTNLEEFYFNSDALKLSRSKENKLTLLLSLLLAKHEKGDKALPLLDDLIRSPQTNRRYKQLARNKFMELREKKREKSSSS